MPAITTAYFPGFTLFAPQSGGGKVYLIDIDGNVVHTWQMPYPPGNSGYLTERGTYFYNGKTVEAANRFSTRPFQFASRTTPPFQGLILAAFFASSIAMRRPAPR